jgi:hypothetical protein
MGLQRLCPQHPDYPGWFVPGLQSNCFDRVRRDIGRLSGPETETSGAKRLTGRLSQRTSSPKNGRQNQPCQEDRRCCPRFEGHKETADSSPKPVPVHKAPCNGRSDGHCYVNRAAVEVSLL